MGDTQTRALSSGVYNVTLKNLSRALKAAASGSLFLGYSSGACSYCAVHEPAYASYDALAKAHAKALPRFARVDADRERTLASRHEVTDLPTIVLAFAKRWTPYAGPHTRPAMAAFAVTQLAPQSRAVRSEAALQRLLLRGAAADLLADEEADGAGEGAALGRQAHELLMLGFFNDPEGEDEEALEDFQAAVVVLRRERPDAAVRAAHVTLSAPLVQEYKVRRRWFRAPPSVVVLVGGEAAPSGGAYQLDERDEDNLGLGAWAARAALPLLGELTPTNFAACAAALPCPSTRPHRLRPPWLPHRHATTTSRPGLSRTPPRAPRSLWQLSGMRRQGCRCSSALSTARTTTGR